MLPPPIIFVTPLQTWGFPEPVPLSSFLEVAWVPQCKDELSLLSVAVRGDGETHTLWWFVNIFS